MSGHESLLDSRFWKASSEPTDDALAALLRGARVVSAEVESGSGGGIRHVVLELHYKGEPTRFLRLGGYAPYVEGLIWAEVRTMDERKI